MNLERTKSWWHTLGEDLLLAPAHITALRMTALLLMLYGSNHVWMDIPLQALCGLLFLSPYLMRQPGAWMVVCAVLWGFNIADWTWIDNHKYLMSYWALVCVLALLSPRPSELLAHNGRWLIGLAFLFALLWKLLAGQYLDGSFLHYTFLGDDRLTAAARALGGVSADLLAQNRALETELALNPVEGGFINFATTEQMRGVALASSYWTLFIEGMVAIAFLIPISWGRAAKGPVATGLGWLSRTRDLWLLVFLLTTYLLLPVLGFAYLLAIMGFCQCADPQRATLTLWERRLRLGYLILFALLQLARLPWEDLAWRLAGV